MRLEAFIEEVKSKGIALKEKEPMCNHTTFRIGGNADVFISVSDETQLCDVIKAARRHNVEFVCIGNGSNLLVSDEGINGAVICLNGLKGITVDGDLVTAAAGVKLSALCTAAYDASLKGLEFAFGIPGSVGGALFMNAGAYGGEISQVVESAKCVNENGEIRILRKEQMQLGYRTSVFKLENLYIIEVTFKLGRGEKPEIKAKMDELTRRRKEKQPLDMPSAGSVFKRPEGYFAGALIEKNGFKGESIGGAMVSPKHAGFIVNTGSATCRDVCELIEKIKTTVFENDGVILETEIVPIGRN